MSEILSIPFPVILFVFAIVMLALQPSFDRKRIRRNIEGHGGKVIEIGPGKWNWGSNDRSYEVRYVPGNGVSMTATCRTNMWRGVYWVNDRPPGLSDEIVLSGEPSGTAEPIQCMDCGTIIPANKSSCPKCGWSYRAHHAEE